MFYGRNEVAVDITVGVVLICIIILVVDKLLTKEAGWLMSKPRRRGRMFRKQRWEYVKNLATYDLTDKIEERVYQGAITREEARELYRMMKQLFPVRNMFPAPELLKENIKKRRASGTHDPVPLPDASPVATTKGMKFVKAG
jgi:hypothetical protein